MDAVLFEVLTHQEPVEPRAEETIALNSHHHFDRPRLGQIYDPPQTRTVGICSTLIATYALFNYLVPLSGGVLAKRL